MKKKIMYLIVIIAMVAFYFGYNDGRNDKQNTSKTIEAKK